MGGVNSWPGEQDFHIACGLGAKLPHASRRGGFRGVEPCVMLREALLRRKFSRESRSVGLRALCNDSPRTPPGPEGSNGNGSVSCAADYPKFLLSVSPSDAKSGDDILPKAAPRLATGSRASRTYGARR